MTPEQKMQAVVEAAGECWHEELTAAGELFCRCGRVYAFTTDTDIDNSFLKSVSANKTHKQFACRNPSPTDLNELFRLAEKRYGTKTKISFYLSTPCGIQCAAIYPMSMKPVASASGNNKAEALLNALYESVKED